MTTLKLALADHKLYENSSWDRRRRMRKNEWKLWIDNIIHYYKPPLWIRLVVLLKFWVPKLDVWDSKFSEEKCTSLCHNFDNGYKMIKTVDMGDRGTWQHYKSLMALLLTKCNTINATNTKRNTTSISVGLILVACHSSA